jgi:hypothetical protein
MPQRQSPTKLPEPWARNVLAAPSISEMKAKLVEMKTEKSQSRCQRGTIRDESRFGRSHAGLRAAITTFRVNTGKGSNMAIRAVLFLILTVATSLGADKRREWQLGRLESVQVASVEPYTSDLFGNLAEHSQLDSPEHNQPLPRASIRFTIRSDTGIYVAERTTMLLSEPRSPHSVWAIDPASIAAWVKELPAIIKFSVQGKTLYYWDTKGKERKARICNP